MPVVEAPLAETVGTIVGAGLTLLIFSYLLGEIPFLRPLFQFTYRFALHVFIGALVGYSLGIVVIEVLGKMTLFQLRDNPILVVPLLTGLWLFFFKRIPRLAYLGNFALAYLIGVGTAVALSGALLGTLVPQIGATGHALNFDSLNLLSLVRGSLIVFGTVCTLMAFNFTFTARKRRGLTGALARLVGLIAKFGRAFLVVAFGVAFAGAVTASLSIFIGRIQFLIDVVKVFLGS